MSLPLDLPLLALTLLLAARNGGGDERISVRLNGGGDERISVRLNGGGDERIPREFELRMYDAVKC
jgi:hypothetical protein